MPAHHHSTLTGRADSFAGSPHSNPTGRAYSYAGPFSLNRHRPRWQLCRPLLFSFQPALLTVMPDHRHLLPSCRTDRYAGQSSLQPAVLTFMPAPPHLLPTGRADRYAR